MAQTCSGLNCLIISQVYGGGGNSGSVLKNDYVELFNRGTVPVSLQGLSVQYAAASSLIFSGITILPNVSVLPGQFYLVQEASGGGGTTSLPTPDFTGTTNLSATVGQVALVNMTTAASTGCPTTGTIVDILGFGSSATVGFCSPAAPAPSTTNSISRTALCTVSSLPSSGFTAGVASPRNTSTTKTPCGSGVSPLSLSPTTLPAGTVGSAYSQPLTASGGTAPYSFSIVGSLPSGLSLTTSGSTATIGGTPMTNTGSPFSFGITVVDSTSTSVTNTYSLVVNGSFVCSPTSTIAQIQGNGLNSPLVNTTVTTSGVVTAIRSNGFYFQMPSPGDGDPTTSDGVFVFTSSAPGTNASIGNSVCVTGMVQEFTPDVGYGTITEIAGTPTVTQLSTGNALPAPVALTTADFNPAGGIYQREKYEGMRISVAAITIVAPTQGTVDETNATATSTGVFYGVIPGVARPLREPGVDSYDTIPGGFAPTIPVWDDNPEILRVNTVQLIGGIALDVTSGATVSNLVGVVDYKYGQYTLLTDPATPPTATGNVTFTATPTPLSTDLTVGSFNLEHFYDTAGAPGSVALTPLAFSNRLAKASLAIRNVIHTPDILALEEVENLTTAQAIAAQIDADSPANPPHYAAYLQQGNDPSDINNAFLVKPSTVTVVSVTQYGLNATYIDPTSNTPALVNDRPPLVLKATAKAAGSNQTLALTVIANHLRSLISVNDNTVSGLSTNGARVRAKREADAEFLANLIQSFQATGDKIVAVGDFNAYQVNDGYVDVMGVVRGNPVPGNQDVVPGASGLVSPILTDGLDMIAAAQRYSDTFDGTAEPIDHFVYSQNVAPLLRQVSYGRVNADFPETYRNDATRPERLSDHDPVIGYLTLPAYIAPTDVTSQVTALGSGLTYNRATQIYSGTITVANKSALTIAGPIEVLLTNLSAGVTLTNSAGTSSGSPYVATSGPLAPGASVTLVVQFTATGNARIGYTSKVYSGAF